MLYSQLISPHLEKEMCGDNPPPEETDRINQSLTCISSAAIFFLDPSGHLLTG